jgi:hypothetical protein
MISGLIDAFKGLWYGRPKDEVEGYLIKRNNNGTILLLVKDGEKCWKTKYFNENEVNYKTPIIPLNNIFKHN